eukprot:TRINITY_DN1573_c0_g1_i1.p1 TRINITY_DN1573_c0_g1~~TRINITY_DN1573_c0_g1_i1.p1  ORF type:complete len:211 (-),score=44.29 TRINITY_DN1573_c0_g1_i1:83-715(-)
MSTKQTRRNWRPKPAVSSKPSLVKVVPIVSCSPPQQQDESQLPGPGKRLAETDEEEVHIPTAVVKCWAQEFCAVAFEDLIKTKIQTIGGYLGDGLSLLVRKVIYPSSNFPFSLDDFFARINSGETQMKTVLAGIKEDYGIDYPSLQRIRAERNLEIHSNDPGQVAERIASALEYIERYMNAMPTGVPAAQALGPLADEGTSTILDPRATR